MKKIIMIFLLIYSVYILYGVILVSKKLDRSFFSIKLDDLPSVLRNRLGIAILWLLTCSITLDDAIYLLIFLSSFFIIWLYKTK